MLLVAACINTWPLCTILFYKIFRALVLFYNSKYCSKSLLLQTKSFTFCWKEICSSSQIRDASIQPQSGINFINILRTNFSYEHCFGSFSLATLRNKSCRNNVHLKNLYVKCWWNWHLHLSDKVVHQTLAIISNHQNCNLKIDRFKVRRKFSFKSDYTIKLLNYISYNAKSFNKYVF